MLVSAHTHAAAEWASAGHSGEPAGYELPAGSSATTFGSIPSLRGGHGNAPDGWQIVQMVMSLEFPDADTGKIRKAGTVWARLGNDLNRITSQSIAPLLDPLSSIKAPDIARIHDAVEPVIDFARRISQAPNDLYDACEEFARIADETIDLITTILEQLLIAVGVQTAAGFALTFFTAGLSDAVAEGADAAEAFAAAYKVASTLEKFRLQIGRALLVMEKVSNVVTSIGDRFETSGFGNHVLLVAAKGLVGGAEGAVLGGGYAAVKNLPEAGSESYWSEVSVSVAIGAASGAVGGGVGDGGFGLWRGAQEGKEVSPLLRAEAESSDLPLVNSTKPSTDSADVPTRPRSSVRAAEKHEEQSKAAEKSHGDLVAGHFGGAGAAAGAATGFVVNKALGRDPEVIDPGIDLDPNVARGVKPGIDTTWDSLMQQLEKGFVAKNSKS
ncbi:hypothetical protein [Frondihabitans sp. PAMC 28766]|uniref:hypothetical protein n=1 Tax=Frondihabitans sp. PAMC 28766 TaxID=1795630 RepID=UPI0012FFC821|nr:hypothetical protein [Frondihabitans sp. PAMC 28766]